MTLEQVMSTETERVILSRTIRVNEEFDAELLSDYVTTVTKTDSGRSFIQCESVDDAKAVYRLLADNESNPISISYSLFFKSNDQFKTEEEARSSLTQIHECNVTYFRLNTDGHTGKLVVDTLDDYNAYKHYEVENAPKFYHFNTNRNRKPVNRDGNKQTFRRAETGNNTSNVNRTSNTANTSKPRTIKKRAPTKKVESDI